MELTKKTTVLFPPDLYEHLAALARERKVSVGHLVRAACQAQYAFCSTEDRLQAVTELCGLSLPVASTARMKRESVPHPDDLLP